MSAYDRWLNEGFDDNHRDRCDICGYGPCECPPDFDDDDYDEPDEALMWGGVDGPKDPD